MSIQIKRTEEDELKFRKKKAREILKSGPEWLRMMVKDLKIRPETLEISIHTPMRLKEYSASRSTGLIDQEYTGEISISIEGIKK